ncbi:hypothetical protein EK21DRAFT_88079 [Setomelanomma holmii]|uniref:Uncharacterized protein n=1 Tax=Setomelanomma holmii TaxID=210430 RepID=A0A9P4LPZ6_9PLEO|nr:hypothetical protein EK21DRAFT_88079 [Setomelanomma holmii]
MAFGCPLQPGYLAFFLWQFMRWPSLMNSSECADLPSPRTADLIEVLMSNAGSIRYELNRPTVDGSTPEQSIAPRQTSDLTKPSASDQGHGVPTAVSRKSRVDTAQGRQVNHSSMKPSKRSKTRAQNQQLTSTALSAFGFEIDFAETFRPEKDYEDTIPSDSDADNFDDYYGGSTYTEAIRPDGKNLAAAGSFQRKLGELARNLPVLKQLDFEHIDPQCMEDEYDDYFEVRLLLGEQVEKIGDPAKADWAYFRRHPHGATTPTFLIIADPPANSTGGAAGVQQEQWKGMGWDELAKNVKAGTLQLRCPFADVYDTEPLLRALVKYSFLVISAAAKPTPFIHDILNNTAFDMDLEKACERLRGDDKLVDHTNKARSKQSRNPKRSLSAVGQEAPPERRMKLQPAMHSPLEGPGHFSDNRNARSDGKSNKESVENEDVSEDEYWAELWMELFEPEPEVPGWVDEPFAAGNITVDATTTCSGVGHSAPHTRVTDVAHSATSLQPSLEPFLTKEEAAELLEAMEAKKQKCIAKYDAKMAGIRRRII